MKIVLLIYKYFHWENQRKVYHPYYNETAVYAIFVDKCSSEDNAAISILTFQTLTYNEAYS